VRKAIAAYAKGARFEIAAEDWFYDPAVSGADPIESRPRSSAKVNMI